MARNARSVVVVSDGENTNNGHMMREDPTENMLVEEDSATDIFVDDRLYTSKLVDADPGDTAVVSPEAGVSCGEGSYRFYLHLQLNAARDEFSEIWI